MGKLGFYSNTAISLTLALGSLASPLLLHRIKEVKMMTIGAILTIPYLLAFLLPIIKL
jgi:hypothetical protein